MDGTGGSWTACTASDGTFDEASEGFSCQVSALSDGSHTIYVRATDSVGNTTTGGSESTDTFTIDSTAPTTPGTPTTTTPTADTTPPWSWTASTDATSGLATPAYTVEWSQDSSFADGVSSATSNTNSFTHTTPLGDATWYVRVKATDSAGNESAYTSNGSVQINTGAPTGSVSINAASLYTNSRTVTLTLDASSGFFGGTSQIEMKLSNLADLSDGTWEAFAATKPWTLTEGDGTKTVYVQFRDTTGNTSGAFMDSIGLDTQTPAAAQLLAPAQHGYVRDERPAFQFRPSSDTDIRHYHLMVQTPQGGFRVNDIEPSGSTVKRSGQTIDYLNFEDQDASNNLIQVVTRNDIGWPREASDGRLLPGINHWQVVAVDQAGNETVSGNTAFVDRSSPSINLTQLNETPLTTNQLVTSDTTPTVFGVVLDRLAGENPHQRTQSPTGPQVASGPTQVEVSVSKRVGNSYQLQGTATIQLTQMQFGCSGKLVVNLHEQDCEKQSSFEFTPREPLTQGLYHLAIAGIDAVGNMGSNQELWLEVTDYQQLVTPAEKEAINRKLATLPTSEVEEYKAGIELVKPLETDLTEDKLRQEISQVGDQVINTVTTPSSKLMVAWGNKFQGWARTTINQPVRWVGQLGSSAHQTMSSTSQRISQLLTRVQAQTSMAPMRDGLVSLNQATVQLATNLENARIQVQEQLAQAVFGVSSRASWLSESVGRGLINLGYQLATEPTQISGVTAVDVSPTTVTIRWTTNHPATGKVNWGNAPGEYQHELQTGERTTQHEFTLTDLEPNTTYHYEVMSQNKNYVYDANRTFVTQE